MKDFSPPSCKQHTLHQLTKRQQRIVHKLSSYIFAHLHKKNSRKKCVSSCVRLLKRKPDNSTVTVRIHSWNAVLETTKHKWDESFVRGIRGFEHVFKAAVTDSISKTNSVTGCRWRKQETQEDLEEGGTQDSFYKYL